MSRVQTTPEPAGKPVDRFAPPEKAFFIHRFRFQTGVFDPILKRGQRTDPLTHFKVIPLRAVSC
jgi:hypothetical protein